MSTLKKFKVLSNFNQIAHKYEAFIIDIWGVLWDGIEPYKNSLESLKKLIKLNKLRMNDQVLLITCCLAACRSWYIYITDE